MPQLISIKVPDWLRTGKIGPLYPGLNADQVLRHLGEPPLAGPKEGTPIPGFWLYGEVEFGIREDGIVNYIQADTVNIGTDTTFPFLKVDWQELSHDSPLATCVEWLRRHNLRFAVREDDDGATITVEESAQLLLTDGEDPRLVTVWTPPMK
jgi:hypothetical protein